MAVEKFGYEFVYRVARKISEHQVVHLIIEDLIDRGVISIAVER